MYRDMEHTLKEEVETIYSRHAAIDQRSRSGVSVAYSIIDVSRIEPCVVTLSTYHNGKLGLVGLFRFVELLESLQGLRKFFFSDESELTLQRMRLLRNYTDISVPLKLHLDTQGCAPAICPCSSSYTTQGVRSSCSRDCQSSINDCQLYKPSISMRIIPLLSAPVFQGSPGIARIDYRSWQQLLQRKLDSTDIHEDLGRKRRRNNLRAPPAVPKPGCVTSMPTIMVGVAFSHSLLFLSKV